MIKEGKITYRDRTNLLATGKMRLCAGVGSKVKMGIRADKLWLAKKTRLLGEILQIFLKEMSVRIV